MLSSKVRANLKIEFSLASKWSLVYTLVNFDLLHIFPWPQQMLEGQDAMDSNASNPFQSGHRTDCITTTKLDGNDALDHMQLKNREEWQKFNERLLEH